MLEGEGAEVFIYPVSRDLILLVYLTRTEVALVVRESSSKTVQVLALEVRLACRELSKC